jgi:hypothetical protein
MPKDTSAPDLRKQKLTTGAKVELHPNGNLTVNGIVKAKIKRHTLNLIHRLGIRTDKLDESPDGYIRIGHTGIHRLLTSPTRDQDRADWIKKGWSSEGRFVVIHLDDNPANFNIENLRNAPQSLNLMLKKAKGYQLKNGKWHASFNVKTGKQVFTPVLDTQAEALHAVDILKLQYVPIWAQEYVFKHGLNRPNQFKQYYSSINSLLDRTSLYQKQKYTKPESRKVSSKRTLTSRPFSEAPEGLKIAVSLSGTPFNSNRDVLVYYKGARGKEIYFVVEKDFYESDIKPLNGTGKGLNMDGRGYLYIGNHGIQRKVLGLEIGDYAKGGLLGCHKVPGLYGKLDNRKRVLRAGNASENLQHQHEVLNIS